MKILIIDKNDSRLVAEILRDITGLKFPADSEWVQAEAWEAAKADGLIQNGRKISEFEFRPISK